MADALDLPIKIFKTPGAFRKWLGANCEKSAGVWLRFFKKGSGIASINYDEALDEALCHGWIDGQVRRFDEASYVQRFTPRRAKSVWSKRNTEHVARLVDGGLMTAAGLKAIEAAKADGRWAAAYDSPKNAVVPGDFLEALKKDKKAAAFFETLSKANKFAIVYRLQTAKKAETRERRMKVILEMLARGEKFHP